MTGVILCSKHIPKPLTSEEAFNYFPDPLAPAEQKATKDYGLRYARAIWSRYTVDTPLFSQQKNRWILNRKYAEGMQSIDKYKDQFDIGDTSWLNLDFSPVTVIPKFVDNIVGLLSNQTYRIQCDVLNSTSKVAEDDERNKLYANMLLKQVSPQVEQKTGVSLVPKGAFAPDDEEELELYMQQNFKSSEALAMELAIQYVLQLNDFKDIEEQLIRDLVNCKIASATRYYDKNKNIKVDYVDPCDLVFPYSKYSDFRNVPYLGVMKKYTIQEISSMTNEFTEAQLYDIAKKYQGTNYGNRQWGYGLSYEGYYRTNGVIGGRPYDDFFIPCLCFEFLGIDSIKYESKENPEKGTHFFNKRATDWMPPKDSKYKREVINKEINNRYEGYWVVGSEYMWGYKKANNVPRTKVNGKYDGKATLQTKVIAPGIYDMQNKSLTERMIPHADQLVLINLKMQQLLMKAIPPGVAVNADAIENVMRGLGQGVMTPLEVIKMFTQTGSLVYRMKDKEGGIIQGKPVDILPNGIPPGFDLLNTMWMAEMNKIYSVIGYNQAMDGVVTSESLVGLQENQKQATGNSLRPLNNSYLKLVRTLSTELSLMIQDKIEYDGGIEFFSRAIGKQSIDVIKAAHGLPLCEFGINVNYAPDAMEIQKTTDKINIALQEKSIELVDAVQVEEALKSNTRLAVQLLVYLQKKRRKERMEEAAHNSQLNSQQQQESAQAAAQGEQQTLSMEIQMKAQLMEKEYQLKAALSAQESIQRMKEILLQNQGKTDAAAVAHEAGLLHLAYENAITPKEEKKTAKAA